MTKPFIHSDKRFSIDDAFEEETDEAIRVYGATGDRSPLQNKFKSGEFVARWVHCAQFVITHHHYFVYFVRSGASLYQEVISDLCESP